MEKVFNRVRKEEDELVYETSIKTYFHPGKGVEIKLACMDHVAKKEYFQEMFHSVDSLEKVLYEYTGKGKLTKEQEESRARKLGKAFRQAIIDYAHALDLSFQLEILPVDSYGNNWEHCDISLADEIKRLMKSKEDLSFLKRQVEILTMFAKRAKQNPEEKKEQLYCHAAILKSKQDAGDLGQPPEDAEVILDYRNNIVKERVKEVMEKGEAKRFGIMYGLTHMFELSDFLEGLGFELKEEKWVEAWRAEDLGSGILFGF